jgi:hypothetical protein
MIITNPKQITGMKNTHPYIVKQQDTVNRRTLFISREVKLATCQPDDHA